jgi:hypothetical protein
MEKYIKLIIAGFAVLATTTYMFAYGPKPSSERKEARKEHLEDREFAAKERVAALARLRTCYDTSQENYRAHWSRACKSVNEATIDECVVKNVPEAVCRSKFAYSPSCELPTYRALGSNKYLDDLKDECRTMYKFETSSFNVGDVSGK